jgi:hypothetical protein
MPALIAGPPWTAQQLHEIRDETDPEGGRTWIAVGRARGVALEIKVLAAPPRTCCLLGVLAVGPRRRLASPPPWVAVLARSVESQ